MQHFMYLVMHLAMLGFAAVSIRSALSPMRSLTSRLGWAASAAIFTFAVGSAVVLHINPALAVTASVTIDEAIASPGAALVAVSLFLAFGTVAVIGVMTIVDEARTYFRDELGAYRRRRRARDRGEDLAKGPVQG